MKRAPLPPRPAPAGVRMRSFASKISFPSAYAVLILMIVLSAALTWVLPAGR